MNTKLVTDNFPPGFRGHSELNSPHNLREHLYPLMLSTTILLWPGELYNFPQNVANVSDYGGINHNHLYLA